ncbi:MAG TPA: lipopolysaccharide biosynthesis protein [Acetobacteraceae bacterium]|nr:lipopolysaccharide biosynthesis protein [Acetobacteraceae bacterium]
MAVPAGVDAAPPRLGRRMVVSSMYMIGARFAMRGIGVISTLVLVRILSPTDFGIVALAQAIYPILDMLTATGFNLAIIRMRAPQLAHYDTAWTLGVIRGAFIAACLIATARWQAEFMHEPRIEPLMWVVAATAFLNSLQNIRLVDYQRNMRFDLLTLYMLWGKVQVFAIVLLLAIFMQNYWILILGNLFNKFITVPGSYLVMRHRPRFSLAGWRDLFHFSKWLFLSNVCMVADAQVMNFVVGHYLGMIEVGLYQVGRQIAALPITEIAAPIRGPVYSAYSKIYHDLDALRRYAINNLAIQALIILPLTVGVACTAPEVVTIFLGAKWIAVIPLLPILAYYHLFDAIGHYTHTIMMALNRQRLYTITYYISIALRIPLTIWWAMEDGIRGAMLAMLVTSVVNAVLWNYQLRSLLRLRWRRALPVLWRPVVAAAVMGIVVFLIAHRLRATPSEFGVFARFVLDVAVGAVVYPTLLGLFWLLSGGPDDSPEAQVLRSVRPMIGRVETMLRLRRRPVL